MATKALHRSLASTSRSRKNSCTPTHSAGANLNPWTIDAHTFEVRDHTGAVKPTTGAVVPTTEIVNQSATTGLHSWFKTMIKLPAVAASVDISYSGPATLTAHDTLGAATEGATMTLRDAGDLSPHRARHHEPRGQGTPRQTRSCGWPHPVARRQGSAVFAARHGDGPLLPFL